MWHIYRAYHTLYACLIIRLFSDTLPTAESINDVKPDVKIIRNG